MAIGLPGFSPNLIQQQQRIAALPSDPQEQALAQHLIRLTQQNKVGTPEYFMAAGEFQNRQRIRQQQQAAQQKPPPVVNELVAQAAQKAAPTTQGVAQLPVGGIGEIGKYAGAGGGIVAFEEGGRVPRFQAGGSPFSRAMQARGQFGENEMERQRLLNELISRVGSSAGMFGVFKEQSDADRIAAQNLMQRAPTMSLEELRRALQQVSQPTPARAQPQTTTPVQAAQMTPANAPMTAADVNKSLPAEQALRSAPAATAPYIPRTMQMADISRAPAVSPYSALLAKAEEAVQPKGAKTLTAAERLSEMQEYMKAAGYDTDKFFKEQRADVEKQKGELAGDKKDAMNMRLIEAGLGILGGESPYAFVNIGKGASPAMKGLQEDLKDIRKLTRDYDKAIRDINLAEQSGKREMGLAALKRSQELSDKIEERKFDLAGRMYSGEVQMAIAKQPGAQERLIERFSRDPKFAEATKGYFGAQTRGAGTEAASRTKAFETWSKSAMLRQQYPDFDEYYALKGGATGGAGFTFLGKEP